jgi:hypothetical protein
MNEDRLTYHELLEFENDMNEEAKKFNNELKSRIDKQRIIMFGTPAQDYSLYERILFGISGATFEPMIYQNDTAHKLNEEYQDRKAYQEELKTEEEKSIKKKKKFKENLGYVKRKFR